jgi:Leucine-rich repeat (LRR) protein
MNQNNDWLNWWNSLPKFWRAQLIHHMEWNDDPTPEQFPQLLTLEQLYLANTAISEYLERQKQKAYKYLYRAEQQMEKELEDFHKYWDDQAMYDYSPEKLRRLEEEHQRYQEEEAELFDGTVSLKYLEKLENLRELQLENHQFTDFETISKLKKLRVLFLGTVEEKNIAPLQYLTELEELFCDSAKVADLSPLYHLKHLKFVSVSRENLTPEAIAEFKAKQPNCILDC